MLATKFFCLSCINIIIFFIISSNLSNVITILGQPEEPGKEEENFFFLQLVMRMGSSLLSWTSPAPSPLH